MNGETEEIKSGRNCSCARGTVTCREAGQIIRAQQRRKNAKVYSIIQNTEFAMAFSTVYSAYVWPLNPFTTLNKVHLLQVSMHTDWGQLICKLTTDSTVTLLCEPQTSNQPNII
jgi:hypothetical protein